MTTPSWVTSMVNFIVSAFNTFVSGIGNGVTTFFQQIFLTNTGTTENPVYELSTFASVSLVMLGVSLAIGVTTLIVHWVRRK